mgnify:FL=1
MAAAKANYWQRGETIDFLNNTNAKIEANTVVLLGKRIGIAGTDIQAKEVGTLHITGVYKFPKAASQAVTAGALVYWDNSANNITTTESSNTLAGFAVEAAGADDATVTVKINA